MLSLVFLIHITSLMPLVLQSDSLSTNLAPSQSTMWFCWVMWSVIADLCISFSDVYLLLRVQGLQVDAFSTSTLCSLMRVSRLRFVSPMYLALQFLHVMEHTPSHIFCGSTLSFGLTSDLLMVLWGFIAVFTLYFFMIRDVVSDNLTYGSTAFALVFSTVFSWCYLPSLFHSY